MIERRERSERPVARALHTRDASLAALVGGYIDEVDFIGPILQQAVVARIRTMLGPAGEALAPADIIGRHGELTRDFLAGHAPSFEDSYFGEETADLVRQLVPPSANEHLSDMLPMAIGGRLRRERRPPLNLLRKDATDLFLSREVHQGFSADRGRYVPALSSRAVSRVASSGQAVVVDQPVVIARDWVAGDNFAHMLFDMVPRVLHLAAAQPALAKRALFVFGGWESDMQRLVLRLLAEFLKVPEAHFHVPLETQVLHTPHGLYGFSDQTLARAHPALLGHAATLRMLRTLLARIPLAESTAKRIYISRNDAALRRLANEEEIFTGLERQGFRRVLLAQMSLAEQMATIGRAEVIVAPHGMGLTHMLFNHGRPRILELFNPGIGTDAFAMVAKALDFPYDFVLGTEVNRGRRDYTADAAEVEAKLAGLLAL